MSPLIGIAVNMLPGLAKRLTRGSKPETQDLVETVVREVLNTDDPQEAALRAEDPQLSGELRLRLAEIEAAADKAEQEAQEKLRQAQLEKLRLDIQAASEQRAGELDELEKRLDDKQDARATMVDLNKSGSYLAWGPVLVSTVVVVGFFVTLISLVFLVKSGTANATEGAGQLILQILNIAVGALTAGFATVISFWLGSSNGSQKKDINAAQAQNTVAQIQKDNVRATQAMVDAQNRQTSDLIQRMAAVANPAPVMAAAAAGGPKAKDARQFGKCLEIIFMHEGGYSDHPKDPGGATNMGITHKTLAAWRGQPVTRDDVRNLTREEAGEIYRANYWNALSCDSLPAGVDLVAFDFGVNAGVRRSAKLLQKLVHVEQDGQIGPITVGAAQTLEPEHIINAFSDGRMEHYRSLDTWETFKKGWTRRTTETRATALEMAKNG
ncbi:glycosyl hydrolase 108 family protein [Fluviibacterium sp. DFM31]|uniref:Glycosyl hydrolase 108 family protein n=1 Tax=Meridianimarinicoccus marinus TaxID=3231483 RepID=A0ABV3L2I4_9RHOB